MGTVCRIPFYANIIIYINVGARRSFWLFFIVEKGKHYELLNYEIKWFNAPRVNVLSREYKTKEICFTSACYLSNTKLSLVI